MALDSYRNGERVAQAILSDPEALEQVDGVTRYVYRVEIKPYSILTLSTLHRVVHNSARPHKIGEYDADAANASLRLPYTDDFEYADYKQTKINGSKMDYLERRSGTPRYTADQNGAYEVTEQEYPEHGHVLQQKIHADNRGYTWYVWGNGSQNQLSTASPATVLGDHTWTNYSASIDVKFDQVTLDASLENFVGLRVRQVVAQGSDLASYAVRLQPNGDWELRKPNTVVASGTVAGFDGSTWHRLTLTADDDVLTPALDGEELTSWTDASKNPVLAGRISLVSGYYNTLIDNLAVKPIKDKSWHAEKLDDTDASLDYTDARFHQTGFGNFNRTTHSLPAGASVTIPLQGAGINLFGATGAAKVRVSLDGGTEFDVNVGSAGDRQSSFWSRGL